MSLNYQYTSHTNHGMTYCKGLSRKIRRWNISYRPVIAYTLSPFVNSLRGPKLTFLGRHQLATEMYFSVARWKYVVAKKS